MLTPQLLEAINGTLLVIFLALVFFFSRYIVLEFRRCRRIGLSWRDARRNRAAAISVLMIFTGDGLIRGAAWTWRHFNLAYDNRITNIAISIGVLICIVGGVCALRHFAPKEWGNWPWVMIPLIGLAFGIGMAL